MRCLSKRGGETVFFGTGIDIVTRTHIIISIYCWESLQYSTVLTVGGGRSMVR